MGVEQCEFRTEEQCTELDALGTRGIVNWTLSTLTRLLDLMDLRDKVITDGPFSVLCKDDQSALCALCACVLHVVLVLSMSTAPVNPLICPIINSV